MTRKPLAAGLFHSASHCGSPESQDGAGRAVAASATIETAGTVALVGSPNAGKTSVFNALTGLSAKTGNYPGVTVGRRTGEAPLANGTTVHLEDLPGTYSLDPISPDEKVVSDVLGGRLDGVRAPRALLVVVDVTTLARSLSVVAQALALQLPAAVVLTMGDELAARGGHVDPDALERALGVPVRAVVGTRKSTVTPLLDLLADVDSWPMPVIAPPVEDPRERRAWADSILASCAYRAPTAHGLTRAVDRVLLHPLWGSLVFFGVMFLFFQTIFTVAAPLQGAIESFFGWLGGLASEHIGIPVIADFISTAVIGGVGSVLVFLPQILLLFLLISLLESAGYMSRAAFLMDRVMGAAGLEGRAFVAMLSSFACAVPGIMATRTIPSARDRIATILAAPLMTCSARLPVFVLLVGLLVPEEAHFGPFGARGAAMFGLYVLGGVSSMLAALAFKRSILRSDELPFFMEMPPYRVPTANAVLSQMWQSASMFLRKVGRIILVVSVALWVLLSLPAHSEEASAAGETAVSAARAQGTAEEELDAIGESAEKSYVMEHSAAGWIGHAMEPVFAPQGFDWRVDIGVLASLGAREVFVATMGQIAAAEDPEDPGAALSQMTYTSGEHEGEKVFTPATTAALLVFFVYALQCMSTVAAMRRETNSWKWPAVAWTYMFVLAWVSSFVVHQVVAAVGS
ncbi:ferrous iron transporter B [Corynebacterium heidelbergense]|uniref:Ferrous iron transporter B n=1 Tax=Corynebacterium heidelbergense TaxID=2055947 RepID=A0A364VE95_9CORY|nr:ferrous iron transporter B [Corynebacterium heidelbergense]RAV34969.1 ferrous iron transporter B [Corynebacterium heidelbergense]WCZ35893.1 Ferrous iron transport protein B [Corynebacterium heidelbergense]